MTFKGHFRTLGHVTVAFSDDVCGLDSVSVFGVLTNFSNRRIC